MRKRGERVIDAQGEEGILDDTAHPTPGEAAVRLASGEHVRIPTTMLMASRDGGYRLDHTFQELQVGWQRSDGEITRASVQEEVVPIAEEKIRVEKRARETGRIRISKHVAEHIEHIDEPLLREEVDVERVPVNRVLEEPVGIRHEGEVMIIPVLEEQLVVRKQLVLKEELHVKRRTSTHHEPQDISLRKETIQTQRLPPREKPREETG